MDWNVNDYAELKENVLLPSFAWHGEIFKFFKVVQATGYPFFCWNGRVYKVNDDKFGYTDTGKVIEEFE